MNLSQAVKNKKYILKSVTGKHNTRRRLLDMGLVQNLEIFVACIAPFGGTILIVARGQMLALSQQIACYIMVSESGENGI